ncbi:hypothetical protein EC396_03480 [Lutibacter sp. HS1-25]|uniref:hypothetical protein n=1 Tax=Lutibacter sp. HS1-25 TaxID=2485000 RepID=UPI0010125E67|nr:hypothetical protein [Lutibacter sp. HS1-25]RXP61880.1 hypothetical protein EC396_03480 [Lutibacter sp. HS1-25]
MKKSILTSKEPLFGSCIECLLEKTKTWLSEMDFIKVEQHFLKELLSQHIIGLCETDNFKNAKLLINGIEHESKLSDELIKNIKEHTANLVLLREHIYVNKVGNLKDNQEYLETEVENYIENFKYIKSQIFELVLYIMKKDKNQKLLAS